MKYICEQPDEISLMSAIQKNELSICPYRQLCSRHFALKIITLAQLYPELWSN